MSHRDWAQSQTYNKPEDTVEALVMAAMRLATNTDRDKLVDAFPEVADEVIERIGRPDGYYPGEPHDEDLTPASDDDTDPFTEHQAILADMSVPQLEGFAFKLTTKRSLIMERNADILQRLMSTGETAALGIDHARAQMDALDDKERRIDAAIA